MLIMPQCRIVIIVLQPGEGDRKKETLSGEKRKKKAKIKALLRKRNGRLQACSRAGRYNSLRK